MPARISVLKLLASQAAIALENARLYRDVAEREARFHRLIDANIIGICVWKRMSNRDGFFVEANDAFLKMVGYDSEDLLSGHLRWSFLTPPEWHERSVRALAEVITTGVAQPYEKEYVRKDGSRVPVLIGAATFGQRRDEGVTFVLDLTERKRAEAEARESDRRYREVQMELAHANRVATLGQVTASIAHEIRQPIAATLTNARAGLRWLGAQPPELEEARQAFGRVVRDANRAGDVISRIRALVEKAPPQKAELDINETVREVIALLRGEVVKAGASVRTELAEGLPLVQCDRVQLQQVMLNLIVNALEAIHGIDDGVRELRVSTRSTCAGVLVAVEDTGPGLGTATDPEALFKAFYTTKPGGLGMGLSICRSIIEAHGGRLWAEANETPGAVFQFTVPTHRAT